MLLNLKVMMKCKRLYDNIMAREKHEKSIADNGVLHIHFHSLLHGFLNRNVPDHNDVFFWYPDANDDHHFPDDYHRW